VSGYLSNLTFQPKRDIESFGSNSICVDAILCSASCGTARSTLPLCVAQETIRINRNNRYVVYLGGMLVSS